MQGCQTAGFLVPCALVLVGPVTAPLINGCQTCEMGLPWVEDEEGWWWEEGKGSHTVRGRGDFIFLPKIALGRLTRH